MTKALRAVLLEPLEEPQMIWLPDTLEAIQKLVDGPMEVVPLSRRVAILCNDEFHLRDLPPNRLINGELYQGTIAIVGLRRPDLISLTPEQTDFLLRSLALATGPSVYLSI